MENIKSLLAEKLAALSKSISLDEKDEAMRLLNISKPTLDKYISGDEDKISKIDTATELCQFFSKKIQARLELIRSTNLV